MSISGTAVAGRESPITISTTENPTSDQTSGIPVELASAMPTALTSSTPLTTEETPIASKAVTQSSPGLVLSVTSQLNQILIPCAGYKDSVYKDSAYKDSAQPAPTLTAFENRLFGLLETVMSRIELLIEKLLGALAAQPLPTKPATNTQTPSSSSNSQTPPAVVTGSGNTSETNNSVDQKPVEPNTSKTLPFQTKLKQIFSGKAELSEVELRHGIVTYQLYQKSPELEGVYEKAYKSAIDSGKAGSEAEKQALFELSKAGKITADEARWVYSLSARAAQLDDNLEYLRTTAGTEDNFKLANALQIAEVNLASIQGGIIKVPTLQL